MLTNTYNILQRLSVECSTFRINIWNVEIKTDRSCSDHCSQNSVHSCTCNVIAMFQHSVYKWVVFLASRRISRQAIGNDTLYANLTRNLYIWKLRNTKPNVQSLHYWILFPSSLKYKLWISRCSAARRFCSTANIALPCLKLVCRIMLSAMHVYLHMLVTLCLHKIERLKSYTIAYKPISTSQY